MGLCRQRSQELNGFFRYLNLRIYTQVLDQPSPFFERPKDKHQFGKLQTKVNRHSMSLPISAR